MSIIDSGDQGDLIDVEWLLARCKARNVKGIADTIANMILGGKIAAGARFPTVRELADALSVSPNTIALVWKNLRQDGMIDTRRRGGTFVSQPDERDARQIAPIANWMDIDLARGSPDPKLQPPLEEALLTGLRERSLYNGPDDHIIEPLVAAVAPSWPFACEKWTIAGGGTEGNLLALRAVVQPGGLVAVEQPTRPSRISTIKALGITPIGVAWDGEGPAIAALEAALAMNPAAFMYQPRAHMPLGLSVTSKRIAEMAALLERYPRTWIVEDDGLGPLAGSPAMSVGQFLPDRTLVVRTYCKAFSSDLRVCILGGAAELIDRVRTHRSYGTGLTSRILQGAFTHLVAKPKFGMIIEHARLRYARRRSMLVSSLRQRGVNVSDGDGVILWLPVADESSAISRLATKGVVLAPGSYCFFDPPPTSHLRLGTSRLPEHQRSINELADIITASVGNTSSEDYG